MKWLGSMASPIVLSLVGGVIGGFLALLFQETLAPWIRRRRQIDQALESMQIPLARSAETLERQLNTLVLNVEKSWLATSQYYRMSLLYTFADFLARRRLTDARFSAAPVELSKRGSELVTRLNGFYRAICSHAYFRGFDADVVAVSAIPRRMLDAIGEVMVVDGQDLLGFSAFCVRFETDAQFRRWFLELATFLDRARPDVDVIAWDRLIATGANLRAIVSSIDANHSMSRVRYVANLRLLSNESVRLQLKAEFRDLLDPRDIS